jgi:flagellar biosynthesis/type III secretory pathway M-ring protein FliF/YscJ
MALHLPPVGNLDVFSSARTADSKRVLMAAFGPVMIRVLLLLLLLLLLLMLLGAVLRPRASATSNFGPEDNGRETLSAESDAARGSTADACRACRRAGSGLLPAE